MASQPPVIGDSAKQSLRDLRSILVPIAAVSTKTAPATPTIPDYELVRSIGRGSYGEVWLARNLTGSWVAIKIVTRASFDQDRPFEREFEGIKRFEPISRSHPSQLAILHVGKNDESNYFYYVMELADPMNAECRVQSEE